LGDLGSSRVFADPAKSSGPAAGIQKAAGTGIQVVSGPDPSLADNADFVVVVAGLTPEDEGEEYTGAGDRTSFALDGKSGSNNQNNLITQLAAKKKPMVVVLEGGSVIDLPWLDQVPAVVMAWYPGMDGGAALGELSTTPASATSYRSAGRKPGPTSPCSPAVRPPRWTTSSAIDFSTRMERLRSFRLDMGLATRPFNTATSRCPAVTSRRTAWSRCRATSATRVRSYDEVAFLFVSYPNTKARRPAKELKGFYRASLDAGQTKRISIPLRIADLKYWDMTSNGWQVESGPV
jgi:beta-glucosidase